ncbi:phosphoribosyltransferase [Clostridium sp. YIM B02555]|uniref:phosphoribosyltransferase n=1 Tax=Clostridium sp. YIM B02555 TaxID=2911968 RepID=UPI001EED6578|nr:phosphoribosyltransferase [Clostridium sp. YIM B02555]
MKYPISLQCQLEEVKEIISHWPIEIDVRDVIKWILQFDPSDYDLAIRIIRNLNVIGHEDIKSALSVAYSKLIRKSIERGAHINNKNTLFAGLGDSGKSGSMISYNFRIINELSEENFQENEITKKYIEDGFIENIVLVDDIISTGHQATTSINELKERVIPYGVKNIFLLTICGFTEGLEKVSKEANIYTFSAFEYDKMDTVASLDSRFYDGISFDDREKILKRLQYYGSTCCRSNPLGYGGIGALIAFYYNTPNTTLPIVWSENNSWIPLFKRARRINGITAYYKQFDKSVKDKTEKAKNNRGTGTEKYKHLSIFVEGKEEEIFFDLLVREFDFCKKLGYETINIIAVGGISVSDRLINKLISADLNSIFIIENNELDPPYVKNARKKLSEKVRYVELNPSVMEFFDVKKIISKYNLEEQFVDVQIDDECPTVVYHELHERFFRRVPLNFREKRFNEFVPDFVKIKKVNSFIENLKLELANPISKVKDPENIIPNNELEK